MRKTCGLIGLIVLVSGVLLSGCIEEAAEDSPTEEIPVVSSGIEGSVVAEAVIEPERSSELTFEVGGDVVAVMVQEGDAVKEGDPLVRLETEDLERAVTQAEITLRQAQVRLEQLQEPPEEVDVEIAEAAVSDAQAAYKEAQLNLTLTEHSVSVGDEVRAARYARDETYRTYQDMVDRFGEDDKWTQRAHDAYLDALGAYNRAVEGAELQLTTARNQVTRAAHALEQVQDSLDDLLEGADALDVKGVQLEIEAAELALAEVEDQLEEATMVAPFDGTVATVSVDPGDSVAVGQPAVVVLATLDRLQARTTDLTELDVARVEAGQPAQVTVDALPDMTFEGVVREIALQPGDYRGDVVYAVTVDLIDVGDAPLRWGMTALVEIDTQD